MSQCKVFIKELLDGCEIESITCRLPTFFNTQALATQKNTQYEYHIITIHMLAKHDQGMPAEGLACLEVRCPGT